MRLRYLVLPALAVALTFAHGQIAFDQAAAARDRVAFVVLELDQWTADFPHRFYMAAAQPPVKAGELSDGVKASADDLGKAVKQLSSLSSSGKDLNGPAFHDQLTKSLSAAKLVNEAFGSQRFPRPLRNDWDQIRTALNELGETYKLETVAYLPPPEPAKAKTQVAIAGPSVSGYIVDDSCALRGKGMWTNAQCVAKCIRDGGRVVLVTEEGKVFKISNPDKVDPDSYGLKVTLAATSTADSITLIQ